MNSISVAGNLTRDGELRTVGTDQVLSFSVADNAGGRDKPAIFWNCQMWGKRGASLAEYMRKGQQVTVAGSVSEREWVDKEGQPRKSMEIRVNDVALQGGQRTEGAAPSPSPAPAAPRRAPAPAPARGGSGFDDMPADFPPF